jgi:hypothetical protein
MFNSANYAVLCSGSAVKHGSLMTGTRPRSKSSIPSQRSSFKTSQTQLNQLATCTCRALKVPTNSSFQVSCEISYSLGLHWLNCSGWVIGRALLKLRLTLWVSLEPNHRRRDRRPRSRPCPSNSMEITHFQNPTPHLKRMV